MSSTKFDVQYLAELARINLTPEEINTFQSQLGHVLEHVEKLNQLDLANVEPTAHSFPIYNVFREDREQPCLPQDVALSNAPSGARAFHRDQGCGVEPWKSLHLPFMRLATC